MKSNPNSALYTDDSSASVRSLMNMVDPTIPLVYNGNWPADDADTTGNTGTDSGSDGGDNGSDGSQSDGSSNSSKGSATSAGIAVGAVAGAAAYGAGMFYLARRYRQRKQLHQRSSSQVDQMSQASGAGSLFGAHVSGSQRSQMISAPVMAENSLGWN
ncbi:hypothetical protein N7470_004711 [Penicillium chermesinum]|nr:hypothetical protein N7470_004711 [Penicillium chermesinum]